MTRVAILWHMHQPFYEDLATREHILPWVRLHAIKDYWGMPALLREFPDVHVTFNIVPSLAMQIQAFADERANDRYLTIGLSDAASLCVSEREFLIANGFHAPVEQMIRPYPRYLELHGRRKEPASWTADEVRDLQVWHKLVWIDPDWLAQDPRLRALIERGRDFGESDKQVLRAVELELLRAALPMYREIAATKRVELSTSPLYHPILPLLCDLDVHKRAHPHSSLPSGLFRRPDDAVEQVRRARELHRQVFGSDPQGIWPSEGAISDEVIRLLHQEGFAWTATDQDILARSIQGSISADALYRPYEVGGDGRTIRCMFRDHELSDRIGFVYQSWEPETAAHDFLTRVRDAAHRFAPGGRSSDGEDATVAVILDGENAWEHYPGGGRPFLRALYGKLQAALDIETVTMAEAVRGNARRLKSVFPGSWINADFYIWAGHRDDHRAWQQLAAARRAFDAHGGSLSPARRALAWEELLVAEGSDWFWWYGDDHSSDHDAEFDDLFRRHLRNVHEALGLEPPAELCLTNISTTSAGAASTRPTALTTPITRGVGSFAGWVGSVSVGHSDGAMHGVSRIERLRMAINRRHLFLRLEGDALRQRLLSDELGLSLLVDGPTPQWLAIPRTPANGIRWVADDAVEVVVPFEAMRRQAGDPVRFTVVVLDVAGRVLEQYPRTGVVALEVPSRHLNAIHWRV